MFIAQDKYILGIMFMIFGVCIWHAVIGGIIHPYYMNTTVAATTTTAASLRTTPRSIYSNVTWPAITTTTKAPTPYDMYAYQKSAYSYPVASETKLADQVALGMVAGTFSVIHLGFFIAGGLSVSGFECQTHTSAVTLSNTYLDTHTVL